MKENYLKQHFYESVCTKKFLRIFKLIMVLLFVLNLNSTWANTEEPQQRKVTGTVTDSKTGESLAGVNIIIQGSVTGTMADSNGQYSIDVPGQNSVLVFSFIGYVSRSINVGSQSVINVTLDGEVTALNEVVVTALGISREKKALGYAVQDISGTEIKKTAETSVINALVGKSAGVYVNSSSGNVGASSRILIRGNNSLKGNNQPLFVVDGLPIDNSIVSTTSGGYDFTDHGTGAADINPSDIADMTILKGGNAAALYGSRGANGVILITTKSGSKRGFMVEIENSTTFSNPLLLPDFQNDYGQGGGQQYWYKDGLNGGKNDGVDESFGPRLDYTVKAEDIAPGGKLEWAVAAGFPQTAGSILKLPQFNSPIDPETGMRIPTPWISHPDNVKSYYETGITNITNVALSNGGKWGNIRLSLTNSNQKGMTPNTEQIKRTFNFSGQTNLTEKLSFDAKGSYININGNLNGSGYTFNNVGMQTVWTGRQVDWAWEKTHTQNPDGTPISWISRWHDNPYWMAKNFLNPQTKNRFIGSASLKYQFTDWLSLTARAGTDYSNEQVELKRAYYSINYKEGKYTVSNYFRQEINADFLLSAFKKISDDLTISGNFGGNVMNQQYRFQESAVARLVVPYIYSLSNAKDKPTTSYNMSEKEIQSLYGAVSLSFRDQLYLDLTGRNDWSSTLPVDNNSYFYPSATGSWIFTKTFNLSPDVFTFGKVRLGWAQVGNDTDPYKLNLIYNASTPYGNNPLFSLSSTLPAQNLKNELITSKELGLDLKFLNNRIGLDLTLYKSIAKNQILNATIASTSGYDQQTINAGQIDNSGIEIVLTGTPVETDDFSWNILVNWSRNRSKIVSLNGEIKSLELYKTEGDQISVVADVGGSYGDMIGTGFVYHENGKPMVDADGVPMTSELRTLGNVMPDWLAGINNSFIYKGFNFSFLIDARVGGDIWSRTNADGWATGSLKSTTGLNAKGNPVRDPIENGGGYLFDGVFADGTPNNIYQYLDDFRWNGWAAGERWLYDATYVKLRELSLSYSLPGNLAGKLKLRGIDIGVFARNVAILYTKCENFDPEVSNRDASQSSQGSEFGSNPSARNIGFRIKLTY
jgi:TonB-linked SusC/RagA family outer membrane protein